MNMLVARAKQIQDFTPLQADKIYLIDFGGSQTVQQARSRSSTGRKAWASGVPSTVRDGHLRYIISFDIYCARLCRSCLSMLVGVSASGSCSERVLIIDPHRLTNWCTNPGSYVVILR